MRYRLVPLFILATAVSTLAQNAAEQSRIKERIALESEKFYARDFEGWADCYRQNEDVYWACVEEDGLILEARGWEELGPFVGSYLEANPDPLTVEISRENFEFRKYGKAVWVAFDEYQKTADQRRKLRGIRILEKQKGEWKIVYMNSYPQPETEPKEGLTAFDPALANKLGADDYGMKSYVMAFLKAGPRRSEDQEEAARLQKAHLDNIRRMAEMGKLVLAGPFLDKGEIRGIYIFDVPSVEDARELTSTDPAIQAGTLVMELHPWYGSAALIEINKLHEKVAKKQF